ncbi:MAG: DUF92 domain-containing protein [Bacteroidia bacterium]|nr:DUF92 domain-containing protein [Bacteroidia bacterium]
MPSDQLLLAILGAAVLLLALATEYSARQRLLPQWLARKLLHLGAIGACAAAPALLERLDSLIWLTAAAELLLIYLVGTNRLFAEEEGRRSWGIALFPVAYLLLLLAFPDRRGLIVAPMAMLALCDAAAAVSGKLLARHFFVLTGDRKSWAGSLAFVLSAAGLLAWLAPYLEAHGAASIGPAGWLWIAVMVAAVEAMGSRGFDNLWVPLAAAWLLYPRDQAQPDWVLIAGMAAACLFGLWTVRRRSLTPDGAVMTGLLGLGVLHNAGAAWLIPLIVFFAGSVLLGRLPRTSGTRSDRKHGQARDYIQVLCNGGLYGLLAAGAGAGQQIYILMSISIAVSTADTWASELGMYVRGATLDLRRMRRTAPGISGGISAAGSLGGLMGAAVIACLASLMLHGTLKADLAAAVAAAGFGGMLADSLLGAWVQVRYRDPQSGEEADTEAPGYVQAGGIRWISNDGVNVLANALTLLAAWGVLGLGC